MGIEPGRHKTPELVENDRNGDKYRQNQCQLQGRKERRGDVGGDHGLADRQKFAQRLGQQKIEFVGKRIDDGETDNHRQHHFQ